MREPCPHLDRYIAARDRLRVGLETYCPTRVREAERDMVDAVCAMRAGVGDVKLAMLAAGLLAREDNRSHT